MVTAGAVEFEIQNVLKSLPVEKTGETVIFTLLEGFLSRYESCFQAKKALYHFMECSA